MTELQSGRSSISCEPRRTVRVQSLPAVVAQKPELKNREPFKSVLSGNREAMAKLSLRDLEEILFATLTGMPVEVFDAEVKKWIETARHPRWNRLYTELTYQPMLEVLQYMRANGYRTYIVTGGGQDFVRVYAQQVYGIPPEQIVGTATGTKFGYGKDGKPFLTKDPKLLLTTTTRESPKVFTWRLAVVRVQRLATRPVTDRCWSIPEQATALG